MKKIWQKIKEHKWKVIIAIAILSSTYYYFFIYNSSTNNQVQEKKTFNVKKGDITVSVSGTGQVYAGDQVDLKPQVAGDGLDVTSVKVENNQEVKKGDVIATLDSTEMQKKIREAQLSLESAEIKMKQTKKQYNNKTEDDVWARKLQKITLEQNQISLNNAYEDLQDYSIKAPFDGVVTGLSVSAGDSISRDEVLASVITKDFKSTISLNEIDAAKVKIGDKASLTFDALDGLKVEGKVSKVATIAEVSQGVVTYEVEIGFDSPSELLKPGMSVLVEIEIESAENVLILPSEAIQEGKNGKSFVLIEQNGQVERKAIETGLSDEVNVEIKNSDLKEGDSVVSNDFVLTSNSSKNNSGNLSGSLLPTMNNRPRNNNR